MKTRIFCIAPGWLALVVLASYSLTGVTTAQTFTTIKSFGILTNVTGILPQSQLMQGSDGTLYGTAREGHGNVEGTVFKVQPDGSDFAVLKWFTNSLEGANPVGGLISLGNKLYGTTAAGGSSNYGTVFRLNTDGTGYAVLKHFTGDDGSVPLGALTLSGSALYGIASGYPGRLFKINPDGTAYAVLYNFTNGPNPSLEESGGVLYGTTYGGGSADSGTIFKVNTDGTGFTELKHFSASVRDPSTGFPTNSDGARPRAGLTHYGGLLYGTANYGGDSGFGTVFKLSTDGTGFSALKHFSGGDGNIPQGNVIVSDGVLYGTTYCGGSSDFGTVFKLNTNGTGYTVLKHFSWQLGSNTNNEGTHPSAGLLVSAGVLYGNTLSGGNTSEGTLFKLNTDGTGFSVLKHFTIYSDGQNPVGGLTSSGSVFYGTAQLGGIWGAGIVFKMNMDGSGYAILKHFAWSDGAAPRGELTLSSNVLYGTTSNGGESGYGTVFKMNADGTGYTVLRSFMGTVESDGQSPSASLLLSGKTLYGITPYGGTSNYGTVFKLNTDGTDYTVLRKFTGPPVDGMSPYGDLTLSQGVLYGTTYGGGELAFGTVFRMNTDGTDYAVLRDFRGTGESDGASPSAGLVLSTNKLYGTTRGGGAWDYGTVFKLNTDGTDYTVLRNFTGYPDDGAGPQASVTLSGNVLYGRTSSDGSLGSGTIFKMNADGTGYVTLLDFASLGYSGLTLSGSTLYGTTLYGGDWDIGAVFRLDLSTVLFSHALGHSIILDWMDPTFSLQAAPYVTGTYTNIPGATSPYTNTMFAPQQFFRLIGN